MDENHSSFASRASPTIERLFDSPVAGGLAVARPILRRVAARLEHSGDLLRDCSNSQMVERLCEVFRQMQIAEEFCVADLERLRQAMLAVDALVEPVLDRSLRRCIETLSDAGPVTVLCLGCGNGYLETSLAARLNMPLRWIGIDFPSAIANAPPGTIFRAPGNRFVAIDDAESADYRALAGLAPAEPALLLACYSVHHLSYPLDQFRRRAVGCQVVLLEQPLRADDWRWPPWRWLFIAYDLYANIAFNPGWAAEFLRSPQKFHVEYLAMEQLTDWGAKVDTLPGVTPWTSVIELPALPLLARPRVP